MNRIAFSDLLTIADAIAQAPKSFVVRRTMRRIQNGELDAAAAAAALRDRDARTGATAEPAGVTAKRRIEALSIGRLFDR